MKINSKKIVNRIYLFLLFAFSGNPFFTSGGEIAQYIFSAFVLFLAINHHKYFNLKKTSLFYIYILFFVLIFLFQKLVLGFISVPGAIAFLLKITLGYIVIRYVGKYFSITYFSVLYFISIISLIGYLYNFSGFDIPNVITDSSKTKSIIFFTQNGDGLRNSGMFWEPGAFACYICLGFLLYLGNIRELLQTHRFKVIVILLALITTFSTTGYLVLFAIGFSTILLEYYKKYRIFKLPLLIVFLSISFFTFENSDFLKNKIESQFENTMQKNTNDFSPDRFGALLFDLQYIKKHPFVGNGLHASTRYADHPWLKDEKLGHGNGFSNFIASMGIFSFLFFSYYVIKYNHHHPWLFLLAVVALLQGEQLMNFSLFLSLPFVFIYENINYHYKYQILYEEISNISVIKDPF